MLHRSVGESVVEKHGRKCREDCSTECCRDRGRMMWRIVGKSVVDKCCIEVLGRVAWRIVGKGAQKRCVAEKCSGGVL